MQDITSYIPKIPHILSILHRKSMESQAKSRYLSFCKEHEVPVFYEPWYLDITCKESWEVKLSEQKEKVVGVWPYVMESKAGFKLIRMPIYTPSLGPLIFPAHNFNTSYKKNSFYFNTMRGLEEKLPAFGYLRLKMSSANKSWFPFYSLGYSQTTRYTYIIDHSLGIDEIKRNMKKQLRNVVTKEIHKEHISRSEDNNNFTSMLEEGFKANKIAKFFNKEAIERILIESTQRNCGTIWTYQNDQKQTIGQVFILEDHKKAYLLFTCANDEGKSIEAVGCLIWHAIKDVISRKKDFDFEGSMISGVEKFFRSFGGEQIPYHEITKIGNPILKLYQYLKS